MFLLNHLSVTHLIALMLLVIALVAGFLVLWLLGPVAPSASAAGSPKVKPRRKSMWLLGKVSARFRSPYGHLLPDRRRVVCDGEVLSDSDEAVALVSRHGLLTSGIVCPICQALVKHPGDFENIAQTPLGEAVFCNCGRMLVASPDDDIDPVTPGIPYDESIYHCFARPVGAPIKPRQKTLSRAPLAGDWVVVQNATWKRPDTGTTHVLDGEEGMCVAIEGDTAMVSLAQGMAGGSPRLNVTVSLASIKVMAFPTLVPGDKVAVRRGPHTGVVGSVTGSREGTITVTVPQLGGTSKSIDVPIEALDKIYQ